MTDDLFDLAPHRFEADAERLEGLGRNALAFVDEAEQNVFGADVAVVEQPRFFLGEHNDSSCPVGKSFEHLLPFRSGPPNERRMGMRYNVWRPLWRAYRRPVTVPGRVP